MEVFKDGKYITVDSKAIYKIAIPSWLASAGDKYYPFVGKKSINTATLGKEFFIQKLIKLGKEFHLPKTDRMLFLNR